ncbi:hypothetical protein L2E82_22691 [Cichorium intybus]|uniref:Uncharacterized protein n=1 Tax=Cichorium intybus TaxID=13427 RepID=A0ACB9DZG7_CICIN|nr:hypothetical protein L2E82_22691 [Cichorium intybus]
MACTKKNGMHEEDESASKAAAPAESALIEAAPTGDVGPAEEARLKEEEACPHDGACPLDNTGKYCHLVQRLQRTTSQLAYKVAMSVNNIITSGAKPLLFLDYYATSQLDVDLAEKVIKGIVDACQQSDCALLGGVRFCSWNCEKESVINGKNITVRDVLIGLPSSGSGVHSNGFSLVRRVLARSGLSLKDKLPGGIKGIAHITGGGFTDNIPRVFPEGLGALVYNDSWPVPPVFKWIQKAGGIEDGTFNMGIGMVLVVSKDAAKRILNEGKSMYRICEVVSGDGVSYQ